MEEVRRLGSLEGEAIREAKAILAFEATRITHSEEEARKARKASKILFEGSEGQELQSAPTTEIDGARLEEGIPAWQLFHEVGLCKSRADARRLIQQGGGYVNDRRLDAFDERIGIKDMGAKGILLRAGKKTYRRIRPKGGS
jgi:tyrosyl-tRNA synthetase